MVLLVCGRRIRVPHDYSLARTHPSQAVWAGLAESESKFGRFGGETTARMQRIAGVDRRNCNFIKHLLSYGLTKVLVRGGAAHFSLQVQSDQRGQLSSHGLPVAENARR